MELRHLLYFKTLAEELHFRNAASRLFISQPPLSRQIKELEEELGAVLFIRNNKKTELTDAGKFLLKETEAIFSRLEESKNIVKQIHESVSGELRIGYISSTYHVNLMSVLKEMRIQFPFVKTMLYEVPTVKQVKALEEGKLDIGILRTPINSHKLKIHSLLEDSFALALPQGENYSDGDWGTYLQNQPFIFFNKDYAPAYHQKLIELCGRMGFYPQVVHEANNVHSILRLVESGLGASIVPSTLRGQYGNLKLSFFDLSPLNVSTEIVLAYPTGHAHPAVNWFVNQYTLAMKKDR